MTYVIANLSNTQRITVTASEDGSWLICKEWRPYKTEDWRIGKGITLPNAFIAEKLGNYLLGMERVS